MIPLFLPPLWQAFTLELVMTGIVRERESTEGGGAQLDRSTLNLGQVQVQNPAACKAGKCFIHCAMPLGQGERQMRTSHFRRCRLSGFFSLWPPRFTFALLSSSIAVNCCLQIFFSKKKNLQHVINLSEQLLLHSAVRTFKHIILNAVFKSLLVLSQQLHS